MVTAHILKPSTRLIVRGGANIEVYPIGIDIENKNNHFIPLNLADYSRLFGDNKLFDTLDKLPHPDLIIASPPCESWSNASAMANGNACWKKEDLSDSLFEPQIPPSMFTIRANKDYEDAYNNYQYDRQFMKRVNGELCAFNTIEIIKRYQPKYWIIENPATGRLWKYIETIIGFPLPYKNPTRYNNYDYPLQKPIPVLKRLIEIFTDEGDVVIDPVAGSGSTLRAAIEMNRSAYGFEIKKDFYKAAQEKMLSSFQISLI